MLRKSISVSDARAYIKAKLKRQRVPLSHFTAQTIAETAIKIVEATETDPKSRRTLLQWIRRNKRGS